MIAEWLVSKSRMNSRISRLTANAENWRKAQAIRQSEPDTELDRAWLSRLRNCWLLCVDERNGVEDIRLCLVLPSGLHCGRSSSMVTAKDVVAALLFGFLFMPFSFSIATFFYPAVIVMTISAIFEWRARSSAKSDASILP